MDQISLIGQISQIWSKVRKLITAGRAPSELKHLSKVRNINQIRFAQTGNKLTVNN